MKKLICWLLGHDYWPCMYRKDDDGWMSAQYADGWMSAQYAECHRCGKRVRLDG